jgi:hypothetical protein
MRGSSTGLALDMFSNDHQFESPQSYLLKAKPYSYRGTRASRMLRISEMLAWTRKVIKINK